MVRKWRDTVILVKPTESSKDGVLAYRDEFLRSADSMDGTATLHKAVTFEEWLQNVRNGENEETVQVGRVPASQYLAVRHSDRRIVGMLQIRHYLNDVLRFEGGHIGFSVRESERRKGYATQMLKLALDVCGERGIDKVLLTCDKANIASSNVIKKNGGILADEFTTYDGNVGQRYWITVP